MDNENIYDAVYKEQNTNNNYNENNNSKKKKGGMGKIIALVVSCSLIGGVAGSGFTYLALKSNTDASIIDGTGNVNTEQLSFKDDSTLSITEAFEKVAPAVVTVSTKGMTNLNGFFPQEVEGIGSGFIINEEGYILTNYHVIEGAKEVTVTLSNNTTVNAKVVNYDQNQDVAMLQITDDIKVPAVVELGNSNDLKQGEAVIAIGTPLSKDLSQTVTNGIVSAMNRNVETETGVQLNLIQTNASINPGNSGGPLVNSRGQVIGINTLKMSGGAEGIGFAIPISDISDKIDALSKPILNLGISVRAVDENLAKQLKLEEGLYVVEVTEFSSAEKSGVKPGDLIVKVDNKRIKTFDELIEIRNSKNEGDIIKLEVIRDGKNKTIDVTLTAQ